MRHNAEKAASDSAEREVMENIYLSRQVSGMDELMRILPEKDMRCQESENGKGKS